MVRAILEGRKTQTRRVVRPQPVGDIVHGAGDDWFATNADQQWRCRYGEAGDRLWVRETWALHPDEHPSEAGVLYRATDPGWDDAKTGLRWKPSIHMPREASRITLEVRGIRVERLQDVSREDAKAEGFWPGSNGLESWDGQLYGNAQLAFAACWKSLHGSESWEANPWVWVVEFAVEGKLVPRPVRFLIADEVGGFTR